MVKNIIFDFDGVLVDSEILVAKAISKYLSDRNIKFKETNSKHQHYLSIINHCHINKTKLT